ncbi:MAG: sucrase ferredoxin [Chloroflexi bacterium]|nr:sucrase ferredoxin [Ardenticatenaceae bacterium]MBL1128660.1 sucrase ferredoxin [Chloroflexota bacterium]NOG34738.1 sucrase ferredoxin [Chloroflexota bacterium]GIK55051.1 MAG: hypothetical protein BroJett015_07140 [Chloroflexota bacterium]
MKAYCNLLALEKGLDPGGQATAFETLILLEAPLPWRSDLYTTVGTMPQEVLDLYALYMQRYHETGVWPPIYLLLIAPDEAYSQPGCRRVIRFQREGAQIAHFARAEYFVPEAQTGPLIWTLAEEPGRLGEFAGWQTAVSPTPRDLLVCTHGTVDAACAKFGFPLYHYLRRQHASDQLRVWRVSHFGGHVFAPTLMELPSGHFWAYVEEAQADQIARRAGPVAALRGHYRGWAGLANGFLQATERELWLCAGWRWFDWPKRGKILVQDEAAQPTWAEVCIEFDDGGGTQLYQARVEVSGHVEMIHTTGGTGTYAYPQYKIVSLAPGVWETAVNKTLMYQA